MSKREKSVNRLAHAWANQVRDAAFQQFRVHLEREAAALDGQIGAPPLDECFRRPPFSDPGETDAPAA